MTDDFEDEENQNVIIDCDILEAAKENIQPLAGGRRATALASVFATPHGLRNVKLEAAKAKYRERVREAQARVDKLRGLNKQEDGVGDDVKEERSEGEDEDENVELTIEEAEEALLDAYVRLVTWTVEHYPRGQSAQSGILELLEEATRVMRHSEYAKSDARYLNLWIRYAYYVDHCELIYEFLLANEIGTKWGKLYEEYATVLDKRNRRPKADEIYLLGIARKAEPLDHLERRHRDFQKRMMVAASVPGHDPTDAGSTVVTTPSNIEPPRRVLADSTSTCTDSSTSTSLNAASSTSDVFSVPTSSSVASLGSQSRPRPNTKMPVFIDPTGEAESAPGNAWPELGTRAERIKENRRAPEKMQGAVLKQRGAAKAATREASARARAAPKIVPYRDPELSGPIAPSGSNKKIEVFKDSGPAAAAPSSTNEKKFIPLKDPELQDAPLESGKKFVTCKDPDVSNTAASTKAKFEVFKDPEPPATMANFSKNSKSVAIKDPQPQSTVAVLEPKPVPFKDPEPAAPSSRSKRARKTVATTDALAIPRRSARLNPKLLAEEEPESAAVSIEEKPQETTVNPKPACPTRFVPFKDEDAGKVAPGTWVVRETAMRPKVLGESGIGSAKAASEAEALRKDPFKNYKDQ